MFSNADKTKFIADITWAAEVQDGRAISRLANHGQDMGIIDANTASKMIVLGGVILQSTHKDGKFYADSLVRLIEGI